MIDPDDITKFDRTDFELLEFWLFCCIVAGKNSKVQAKKLDEFFMHRLSGCDIATSVHNAKLGQYSRLIPIFQSSLYGSDFSWLREWPAQKLCAAFKGVGPKTSRFFVLHTRENVRAAALDTYILTWLRNQGFKAPKATPSEPKYTQLEEAFLALADEYQMTPADLDLEVWKSKGTYINKNSN